MTTANPIFNEIISTTEAFIALLEEETTCLNEQDIKQSKPYIANKQHLWHKQQQLLANLSPEDWTAIDEEIRTALISQFDRLHETLTANNKALEMAQRVQQYLIDTIVNGVKQQQAPSCFYTKDKQHSCNDFPLSISAFNVAV